jgi:hypothetical protein
LCLHSPNPTPPRPPRNGANNAHFPLCVPRINVSLHSCPITSAISAAKPTASPP